MLHARAFLAEASEHSKRGGERVRKRAKKRERERGRRGLGFIGPRQGKKVSS